MKNTETKSLEDAWIRIQNAMEGARPVLVRSGFVARKTQPSGTCYWVIRYRDFTGGQSRLRSISIGSHPEVVSKARYLLATWQADAHPDRSPIPGARESWQILKSHAKSMKREQARMFLDHLRPVARNPVELLAAVQSWPERLKAHRQGNRLKRRRRTHLRISAWPSPLTNPQGQLQECADRSS